MEPDCKYFPFKLGVAYPSYFYPMSFVALVLWTITSYRLFQLIRSFRTLEKWKEEFSVRHLAILMLWLGLLGRIIFFATNLDGQWDRNTTGFFPFFFYIFYPCVGVAFSCELLVWMELYTTTTLHNIEKLPKYRKYLLLFNGIVFPVEITLRIAITLKHVRFLLLIWFSFLGVLVLSETIGFLVVALLLLKKVSKMKSLTGQNQQKAAFMKLTGTLVVQTFIVLIACLLFVATTFTATKRAEMFLLVNVLARFIEYVAVIFILVIIKPQTQRVFATTSTQPLSKHTSVEKSNSMEGNSIPMSSVSSEDNSNNMDSSTGELQDVVP